ncbi:hypothetical protein PCASD_25476 [Puccinia coronata f. sp. avenae]|uniref:Uncharacterized protein n=1 Tax=Puccinia coronata f. sp. avenae TaxID=200324 RepID=A0A2N5S1K9_9BASI|nr:hypothetical protein PCASD_25476 [Puccinia coronata f. sp. avenae]
MVAGPQAVAVYGSTLRVWEFGHKSTGAVPFCFPNRESRSAASGAAAFNAAQHSGPQDRSPLVSCRLPGEVIQESNTWFNPLHHPIGGPAHKQSGYQLNGKLLKQMLLKKHMIATTVFQAKEIDFVSLCTWTLELHLEITAGQAWQSSGITQWPCLAIESHSSLAKRRQRVFNSMAKLGRQVEQLADQAWPLS